MSEQNRNTDVSPIRHDISDDITIIRFQGSTKIVALISNLGRFDGTLDEIITEFKTSIIDGLPDFSKMTDDLLKQKITSALRDLFLIRTDAQSTSDRVAVQIDGCFKMHIWVESAYIRYELYFNRPRTNRSINPYWLSDEVTEAIRNAITDEFLSNASTIDLLADLLVLIVKRHALNIQYVSDRFQKCLSTLLAFQRGYNRRTPDDIRP